MQTPSNAYKRPESVLVVVYTRSGKALMLQRADDPSFWQSITGSMEWNDERPPAAAARELREETGLHVSEDALHDWQLSNRYVIFSQWLYKYAPGITENTEHIFSLCLPAEVPITLNPAEHSAYAWLPLAQAAQQVFSWTNRDALQTLMKADGAKTD